jgi:phosphate-selective porin OprO/OprP
VLVDTGTIEARDAGLVSLEAAFVRGPFSVFGEILGSAVETAGGDLLTFGGGYVTATWLLTRESRPYDRRTGVFTRVVPRREVSFHESGGGAWEWSLRWAYVDLSDGDVRGERMGLWSTGISWYLTRFVRVMAEYGFARVEGGDLHTAQARVAFRF